MKRVGKSFLGVWIVFSFFLAQAQSSPSNFLIGHNLTPTSYVLPEGEYTVGNYAVGYGITRHWTLATSPWMIVSYNMPMITSKVVLAGLDSDQSLSWDISYFKTFPYLLNRYKQESVFTRLVATQKFTHSYALHVCAGFQYFKDESRPFSLHLETGSGSAVTTSLSALNEIWLTSRAGIFLEGGILGLNYRQPYFHLGASLFVSYPTWMVQLGASLSTLTSHPMYDYYRAIRLLHPEIQLQFLL